jgi:hypothetical protein
MIAKVAAGLVLALLASTAQAAVTYVDHTTTAGDATDLSGFAGGPNGNRLSFGSDLFYDKSSKTYWGITDRGPGGGLIDFAPRVTQFDLSLNGDGSINNLTLLKTIVFKKADGSLFTGLNPRLATGDAGNLGLSFDSEGFVKLSNGNMLVADEYGPSVYEFDKDGVFLRAFETPANLLPREAGGALNFVDGRPTIVSGRQDNRGFEGLTVSPDGKTAYAILQDPLVNEGRGGQGRRSRNLRIVAYDVETGVQTAQYAYQLESIADINERTPNDFEENQQGRNIGVSSITAVGEGKFLVIERDNRGWGVEDPTASGNAIGTKRVYLINLAGATDVKDVSFAGSSNLPEGVVPVQKKLFLDVFAELTAAGVPAVEKLEGLAFGPYLDGGLAMVIVSDNDFSVTQTGQGDQFDVCTSGIGGVTSQVALGAACPDGQSLIPTFTYVFKVSGDSLGMVPEPATWAMMIAGFGLVGGALRRRQVLAA